MVIFLSEINYTIFSTVFQVVMLAMLMVLCYTVCRRVGTVRSTCHRGVITIRFLWSQGCAGSSPVVRTKKRQSERVVFFYAAADLKQNYVLSANETAFVCPCTLCSWRNALQVNLLAYAITLTSLTTSPVFVILKNLKQTNRGIQIAFLQQQILF